MQCDEPWCEKSCPKNAISKDMSSGVVTVDDVKCVGCRTCVSACPFGMIKYVDSTGKADKCNLCAGDTPECVAFCPTQCLTLDEEDKPLRQKMLRFVNAMKDGQMEV
jgi:Fe-S-cluster-containing hydrogenase component 2